MLNKNNGFLSSNFLKCTFVKFIAAIGNRRERVLNEITNLTINEIKDKRIDEIVYEEIKESE